MKYNYHFNLKNSYYCLIFSSKITFLLSNKVLKDAIRDSQHQGYSIMNMPVLKKRYVNDSWFMAPKAQVLEREVFSYNVSECKVYFDSFDSTLLALNILGSKLTHWYKILEVSILEFI